MARGFVQEKEYQDKVVEIKRVSKKTKGGDNINFSVLVVIGNKAGEVGVGLSKSSNVASAVRKAQTDANRNKVKIALKDGTISHEVNANYAGSEILIMPAPEGSGLIAGGAVRTVLELAGVRNASSKMLGSSNKTSNVRCTIKALQKLKG